MLPLPKTIARFASRKTYSFCSTAKYLRDNLAHSHSKLKVPNHMIGTPVGYATDGRKFISMTPIDKELFTPLKVANHNHLLPSISGKRNISDIMRMVLALPTRHGGLGMANPQEDVTREYTASCSMSRPFSELILQQEGSITPNCDAEQKRAKTSIFQQKSTHTTEAAACVLEEAPAELPRMIELASEKEHLAGYPPCQLKNTGST